MGRVQFQGVMSSTSSLTYPIPKYYHSFKPSSCVGHGNMTSVKVSTCVFDVCELHAMLVSTVCMMTRLVIVVNRASL